MKERLIIVSYFKTYNQVLSYTEQVELEYHEWDMECEVEIFHRIVFDDYRVVFTVEIDNEKGH